MSKNSRINKQPVSAEEAADRSVARRRAVEITNEAPDSAVANARANRAARNKSAKRIG